LPTGIFYALGVKTNVLFFTRGENDKGNTKEVWVYDLRANMPQFGKRTVLARQHFAEFEKAFGNDPLGSLTSLKKRKATGITQELKSAIKCWCYEQHQHCTNPCNGNVPDGLTVSQHTHELCEFSSALRSRIARHLASRSLSEGPLVPTAMGIFRAETRADGRLSGE
jgi:hypothetical protein